MVWVQLFFFCAAVVGTFSLNLQGQRTTARSTPETPAHRRLRRLRTRARTLLRVTPATPASWSPVTARAVAVLEKHHSKSTLPGAFQRAWADTPGAMPSQGQGWWCWACARWCKAKAIYCDGCGVRWDRQQTQQQQYAWEPPRTTSPRRRQKSPRRKGGGKGREAETAQVAALQQQLPVPPAPPPPALRSRGKGGPQASTIATAVAHPVAPPVPETDAQLSSLLSALATHKEALPESIRQMVDAQAEASAASRAKTMHKCIATQTSSTKQLQSLRLQRTQYMAAWTKYLEDLEVNLRQQMEEKSSTMAQFAATEDTLMEAIEQAREQMLVMAGGEVKKEEDEMEVGEVPEAPTAAEAVEDLGTAQKEKVLLEALKKATESASKEKGAAKRERTPRRKAKDGEAQAISSDEQGL